MPCHASFDSVIYTSGGMGKLVCPCALVFEGHGQAALAHGTRHLRIDKALVVAGLQQVGLIEHFEVSVSQSLDGLLDVRFFFLLFDLNA